MQDRVKQVVVMGSGTSAGVPVIGCDCPVCTSGDPINQRTRCSILLRTVKNKTYLIDTPPELRLQLLSAGVKRLDGVFLTHTHADHLHGFDDLRAFFFKGKIALPCYGGQEHLDELKDKFSYAFQETNYPGVKPQLSLCPIATEGKTTLGDLEVETFRLPHGPVWSTGYRFGNFAFFTDFLTVSSEQVAALKGEITTMVASGIHHGTHPTHSTVPGTLSLFQSLDIQRGVISHLSHKIDYLRDTPLLPPNISYAYDGMVIDV